jgi:hypothetical protein
MPEKQKYDVFLSYSMKDREWVAEFADTLSRAGVTAWFDVAALSPGERWQEHLQEALRVSRTLVMILSPQSLDSPWLFFELGAAVADNKRIIPVVTGDVDLTRIPTLLRQYQFLREPSARQAGMRVAEVVSSEKN